MRVALVNTNRMKPPVAPIGLEYVAEALNAAGHAVSVLDLCWPADWRSGVAEFFAQGHFGLVGLGLRNTDDCAFSTRESFLGEFSDMVRAIRGHTDAALVLGGVGFSVMPEDVLELCGADVGVWGDGEFPLVELANQMDTGRDWRDLPNLVVRLDGKWRKNPPADWPLAELPPMRRTWFDNRRYFREGGQAGVETKRGCPGRCIYCADPLAKGRQVRVRAPQAVADELEGLLAQGIGHVHTCDSEFNVPEAHATDVCTELVRRKLGGRLSWYAYCAPRPFSQELALLMRQAGCAGTNFGVDSGDESMLRSLGREHTPGDILNAARWCKDAGIAVMFDLLLGSPGETKQSITRTIELMKRADPDRVGVDVGVRVYPGTELSRMIPRKGLERGLMGQEASKPLFFLEPGVAPFVFELLDGLIGDDRRFFFFDPSRPDRNYNYNANQVLVDAIAKGHRGAYWDILRRLDSS